MKNRLYPQNQVYIITILFIYFCYAIYLYIQYQQTVDTGILLEKTVIQQGCNAYGRGASGVIIKHNNRTYSVKLDYEICEKYPINSNIDLLYNKKIDKFFYPVKNYGNYKNRIILVAIFLITSAIPWSFFKRSAPSPEHVEKKHRKKK